MHQALRVFIMLAPEHGRGLFMGYEQVTLAVMSIILDMLGVNGKTRVRASRALFRSAQARNDVVEPEGDRLLELLVSA